MKKIKSGDPVIVIAWKHKGKVSTVEKVIIKEEKCDRKVIEQVYVIVKGVNEVKKAVKGQGFVKKTLPMHVSNVMYYNEKDKKGSKIGITIDKKWMKKRVLKQNKDIVVD